MKYFLFIILKSLKQLVKVFITFYESKYLIIDKSKFNFFKFFNTE